MEPFWTRAVHGLAYVLAIAATALVSNRLFRIGAALRQPDAIELMKLDTRPPVLYLRSFDDDAVPDLTTALVPFGPKRSIELRLAEALADLGPVISIGRPGERLPEIGTNRFYVSDDDWQRAVLYFLLRAAAVVILVGRSAGVAWEISTTLRTVPFPRLLVAFPYLLPKDKRTRWRAIKEAIRPHGRGDDSVSKTFLADLKAEQEARYQSFRERSAEAIPAGLPPRLDGAVFVDFAASGRPQLMSTRQPLFVRRPRDRQALTMDYRRTLRPFLEKLQGRTIEPGLMERLLTNRYVLGALTVGCGVVGGAGILAPFWIGFESPGVVVGVLASWVFLTAATYGARNLSQYVDWGSFVERIVAGALLGMAAGILSGILYAACALPQMPEAFLGALAASVTGGLGGMVAGLMAGFQAKVLTRIAVVAAGGAMSVLGSAWGGLIPLHSPETLDVSDLLLVAFPFLLVGGAIWGVLRARPPAAPTERERLASRGPDINR